MEELSLELAKKNLNANVMPTFILLSYFRPDHSMIIDSIPSRQKQD